MAIAILICVVVACAVVIAVLPDPTARAKPVSDDVSDDKPKERRCQEVYAHRAWRRRRAG